MNTKTILDVLSKMKRLDPEIENFAETLHIAFNSKRRIWFAGNGGSASTVSHFASDLANLGLDVFCMNDNQARFSALVNDSGWSNVYIDQMNPFRINDVLIVASVHGGVGADKAGLWSQNLVLACDYAYRKGGKVLALLGGDGGVIKDRSSYFIIVPHDDAYVVEGLHSVITHLICAKLKEMKK